MLKDKNDLKAFIKSGRWKTEKFKVIDTDPDIGNHSYVCSCEECVEIKKVVFTNATSKEKEEIKGSLLEKILQNDGIW